MNTIKILLKLSLVPALMCLMLLFPKASMALASEGLFIWFHSCVPALFPFMILSGYLIHQNLTDRITHLISPVLSFLFSVSENGCYCIFTGFLCGFPMGATSVVELYRNKRIKKNEAQFLLSFCNNIGPAFFLGIVLPALKQINKIPTFFFLFGMYGIPLLYGMIQSHNIMNHKKEIRNTEKPSLNTSSCMESLEKSIHSAIENITVMGGYLILGNLMYLIPLSLNWLLSYFFLLKIPDDVLFSCRCLLEITGGISALNGHYPLFQLSILPLGGVCCIMQTKNLLKHTDLSILKYLKAKFIQSLFSFLYYFLLLRFFL